MLLVRPAANPLFYDSAPTLTAICWESELQLPLPLFWQAILVYFGKFAASFSLLRRQLVLVPHATAAGKRTWLVR